MNLNVNQKQKSSSEILKHIYGNRAGGFYNFGLVEATHKYDFKVKLFSFSKKQESLCPGFHDWVRKKKSDDFVASIIQSAREGTDVKGLYFQNDAESIHFLEKLSQEFNK